MIARVIAVPFVVLCLVQGIHRIPVHQDAETPLPEIVAVGAGYSTTALEESVGEQLAQSHPKGHQPALVVLQP